MFNNAAAAEVWRQIPGLVGIVGAEIRLGHLSAYRRRLQQKRSDKVRGSDPAERGKNAAGSAVAYPGPGPDGGFLRFSLRSLSFSGRPDDDGSGMSVGSLHILQRCRHGQRPIVSDALGSKCSP